MGTTTMKVEDWMVESTINVVIKSIMVGIIKIRTIKKDTTSITNII